MGFLMEYFLLFIHYGFYVFFIMCFAAYVFAVTSSKKIEILSMVMLAVYTIMELSAVLMVNSYCGNGNIYILFSFGWYNNFFYNCCCFKVEKLCRYVDMDSVLYCIFTFYNYSSLSICTFY